MTDPAAERVARFVDDLLHGRRPRRFNASQEEVEAMTAAAGLVAGRVGADWSSAWHWTRWRRISRLRARMAPRPQCSCQTTEHGVG